MHAARFEVLCLFPAEDYAAIPDLGGNLDLLWLESAVWAAYAFNCSATMANPGKIPTYQIFTGQAPPFQFVSFLQLGMMRVSRRS